MRVLRVSGIRAADLAFPAVVGAGVAVLPALLAWRLAGTPWAGAGVAAVVIMGSMAWALRRPLRRARIMSAPLSAADLDWLRRHVPLYRGASGADKERFEGEVAWALHEWSFEGVDGVTLTDELRLGVAAGVATLLHGRPGWKVPGGRSVIFYPSSFNDEYDPDGDEGVFSGMAHGQGPILLSAPDVRHGWARSDGFNVVLHELAHRLDFFQAQADGVPSWVDARSVDAWEDLVRKEMWRAKVGRSILSRYASTAPEELFAVATEAFFERPWDLHEHHPDLFKAMREIYQIDPTKASERSEEVS